VQNGNAYAEGLSDAAREFIALTPETPGGEQAILDLFTLDATRGQYEGGTADPALVAPEGWLLDQFFLDQPGRKQAQLALAYDYHRNVAAYPEWQSWLRAHRPPTVIAWGVNDPFFTEAGARAYLRDVPDAELHLFDTGHFALEDHLPEVAPLIATLLDRTNPSR
jgi:pimeloyl-ACP methyl ester carboxylesterase